MPLRFISRGISFPRDRFAAPLSPPNSYFFFFIKSSESSLVQKITANSIPTPVPGTWVSMIGGIAMSLGIVIFSIFLVSWIQREVNKASATPYLPEKSQ